MGEEVDFSDEDYRLHLGDDDDEVIFDIPEGNLQRDEDDDWGLQHSHSRQLDYQTEDEDFSSDSGQLEYQDLDQDLDDDDYDFSDEAYRPSHGHIPDVIVQLQKQLLGDYTLPPCPVEPPGGHHTLSSSEALSCITILHGQTHKAL